MSDGIIIQLSLTHEPAPIVVAAIFTITSENCRCGETGSPIASREKKKKKTKHVIERNVLQGAYYISILTHGAATQPLESWSQPAKLCTTTIYIQVGI